MRIRQVILDGGMDGPLHEPGRRSRAEDLDKQRCPKPGEFALVFSFGYGSDTMPPEDARFTEFWRKSRRQASTWSTAHTLRNDWTSARSTG